MSRRVCTPQLLAVALLVGIIASSTVGPTQAQQPRSPARTGGVLIYPNISANHWITSLDPATVQDTQSLQVVNLIYSGLLKLDQYNKVVPDLAAAMPLLSADKTTYSFTIRPDAKFSDGTPVTARDFVSSWTRALSPREQSPIAASYMPVVGAADLTSGKVRTLSGVKALNAHAVQITFTSPCTCHLGELTYQTWYVLEQKVRAGADLAGATKQALNVGSGPFRFGKPWQFRHEMYLVPNAHWYNAKKIRVAAIDIPMVSDSDVLHRAYLAGQLPMSVVPARFFQREQKLPDFHRVPQLAIDYISLNQGQDSLCKPLTCAPFNNLHFRRAMLYAIDRNTINGTILHGADVNLCGIVPQGIDGYSAGLCSLTPYDPKRAKAELRLAVQDFGGTIRNEGRLVLVYQANGQEVLDEYTEIQREWAAVGITIRLKGASFKNWVGLVTTNTTPLAQNTWAADYPDPQDFTHNLLSVHGAYDITNYHDPAFETLIAQGDVTPPGPKRTSYYIRAQARAIGAVAFISIGQVAVSWRWSSNIHGLVLGTGFNYPIAAGNDWTNVSVS